MQYYETNISGSAFADGCSESVFRSIDSYLTKDGFTREALKKSASSAGNWHSYYLAFKMPVAGVEEKEGGWTVNNVKLDEWTNTANGSLPEALKKLVRTWKNDCNGKSKFLLHHAHEKYCEAHAS